MRISLCMIVKDCSESLRRVLTQVAEHFDEIIIVDTQSEDGGATVAVAREFTDRVFTYERPEGFPWVDSFSKARNLSFDKATGDWIMWLDSDDELVGANKVRNLVERAESNKGDCIMMRYDYAFDENGNCVTRQWRERIVRKGLFRWQAPLHEVLIPNRPMRNMKAEGPNMPYVLHRGSKTTDPEHEENRLKRNLAILDRWEEHGDPEEIEIERTRMSIYRGNIYAGLGDWEKAVESFQYYLEHSGWAEEMYVAQCSLSNALWNSQQFDEALGILMQAIFDFPNLKPAYIHLAQIYAVKKDWDRVIHYVQQAFNATETVETIVDNPLFTTGHAYGLMQQAYFFTQRFEEALDWGKKAALYYGDDHPSHHMLEKTQEIIRDGQLSKSFNDVRVALQEEGNDDKTRSLMHAIPKRIADFGDLALFMDRSRPKDRPTVSIFCGPGPEPWGPSSLARGIGGSEEAVINMSYELNKLGWHVEVYAFPPKEEEGEIGGVHWLPHWAYNVEEPTDVFVAWRGHQFLEGGETAKARFLWLHDKQEFPMEPKHIELADGIMVLSKHQRADIGLVDVPEEKILYSANGLSELWLADPQNEATRAIYSSCPTRGLKCLLTLWPRIREEVPEAELDVYYGFTPLFEEHAKFDPNLRALKEWILEHVKQPGVTWHGRVGQKLLAQRFARAGVWLYPTEFPEISCITAMKAQAMGCWPVTSGYAALAETCGKWDRGPVHAEAADMYTDEARQDAFVVAAVEAMRKPQDARRAEMAQWARKTFAWSGVSEQWSNRFLEVLGRSTVLETAPSTASPVLSTPS